MLALPVERLVGNSSTGKNKEHTSHHHHHSLHSSRHSLSPDSIVSESSSTISSSSSSSTSGESHISDIITNENIPQSPYANDNILRSPSSNNNYSCKMHVTMKKSEVSSATVVEQSTGTSKNNNLISPQSNSSLSPNSLTDSNNEKSYKIPYYRHPSSNSNNNGNGAEKITRTDSRRSLSPEQQKNDEVSLVVVKSEVDLDNTEMCEEQEERLRSNNKRLSPPQAIVESENEDMNEHFIRNGERKRIVESANANRSGNHNGRRINNNNSLHSSAKESSSSFNSTSGDHRDKQRKRRNDSRERSDEEEEDEQIHIDVDGDMDGEDRNCNNNSNGKDRQRIKHHNNRIEDDDSNNIITSHQNNSPYNFNHNYRPPSRPLSTSSSISTFSTASSQSNFKGSNQQHQVHHYFHSHLHPHFSPGSSSTMTSFGGSHNNSSIGGGSGQQHTSSSNLLKFSIEDILRPDFGLNLTSPSPPSSKISRSGPSIFNPFLISPPTSSSSPGINHNHHPVKLHSPSSSSSSLNRKPRNGSVSSTDGHRPYRPSSVNCHSEDSNGSCKSRTREEVVDDSKVNPPVPKGPLLWPAWVYCTRYSDRPSSGPRSRRIRKSPREQPEEKRPRTAFTAEQLARLKQEFEENRYLTEKRRQDLALDLKLHENQIKIWFQNKRAKLKKSTGTKNGLALQLMAQGLYNHSTVPVDEDEEMEMLM